MQGPWHAWGPITIQLASVKSGEEAVQASVLAESVFANHMLEEHLALKAQLEPLNAELVEVKHKTSDLGTELKEIAQIATKRNPLEEWREDNEQSA